MVRRPTTRFESMATIKAIPTGPFRWAQKPDVKLLECGDTLSWSCCCYHGFTHSRAIEFDNFELTVNDEIAGPIGEHDIEQFWHFALQPLWPPRGNGQLAILRNLLPWVESLSRRCFRCFGAREPAWVIVVRRRARCRLLPPACGF